MSETSIYRFFGFSDVQRDLNTVLESELFFNTVDGFNDPFEARPHFTPLVYDPEMEERYVAVALQIAEGRGKPLEIQLKFAQDARRRLLESGESMAFDAIQTSFSQVLTEIVAPLSEIYGVACFSTDSHDKKAATNEYMWFHYGNGLRGLCIEFDKDKLIDSIGIMNKQPTDENEPHVVGKDVNYVRIRPGLDTFRYMEVYSLPQQEHSRNQWIYDYLFDPIFFTKPLAFSAEHEFRIIVAEAPKSRLKFSGSAIKNVFFGQKMDDSIKQKLKLHFQHAGVNGFFEAKIDHSHYRLNLDPY